MEHLPEYSKIKSFSNLAVIYKYWRARRIERGGKPIIPQLKFEEALKNETDPYVCFRRRETKPIRKTRRTDQQSLERLRKLRTEMEMARNLLEMVLRREKIRKEGLILEHTVFEKKRTLYDYQRKLGIKEDDDLLPLSKKKRKISLEGSSGATIKIPLHKLNRIHKSPAQLAIEAEIARKRELDLPYEDVTACPYQPFPISTPQQFFQSFTNTNGKTKPNHTGPRFRKRMGRNGRIFIDRIGYEPTNESHGGKTLPGAYNVTTQYYGTHHFDSDMSEDEECKDIDEMDSLYLKHRVQLLSETELRNLVTVPFLTPMNMINNQVRRAAPSSLSAVTPTPPPIRIPSQQQPPSPGISTTPIKRQNSRTKMTPQEAAVAMANGMIAANLSAVVNGSANPNKAAMQMAMAAAQQQQGTNKSSFLHVD